MDKQQAIEAMRLIIKKSELGARQAAQAIQAISNNSPVSQQRINFVITQALGDYAATFTDDDRALFASVLDVTDDSEATTLSIRLTKAERAEVSRMSQEAGSKNDSEFIRERLGL